MSGFMNILLVAGGSAAGGVLRYLLGRWIQHLWARPFPLGTLLVNLAGCLLIGIFYGHSIRSGQSAQGTTLLLTTGFCGGFTTFSAFAYENILLMREGAYPEVLLYMAASACIGILAAWAGLALAR